ncbi:MAG: alpha/beta hydrolase [Caldilinea sp. CFX5]|nr:alpha/beta hydrolase [Caldilinea sp. CFX5]
MNPFYLFIELLLTAGRLRATWYGQSALTPVGLQEWPLAPGALVGGLPASFPIDLRPLLDEVIAGLIEDERALAQADDLLPLRDLLTPADFSELATSLFDLLWQEAQLNPEFGLKKGLPERVWSDPDRRLVRVWFATNRQPRDPANIGLGFDEAQSAEELTYGACHVFIPKSHKPGSVGSPWWRRWLRLAADDRLELRAIEGLAPDQFWATLAGKLQSWWAPGERNLFVLIHGYNVGFGEAAIRAAQIGYDLKVPGEMAFFSWPSRGTLLQYAADEATIEASYPAIAQFLRELAAKAGAERIHIFVHSMGNRGLLNALERLVTDGAPELQLGQVFFCAPDVDVRVFKDKATRFPHRAENRTLLISPQDRPVALAEWLHQYDRVGVAPPVTVIPGIETIEVRGFGLLDLGHGYFAEVKPIIEDLRTAILTRQKASERAHLQRIGDYYGIDLGAVR